MQLTDAQREALVKEFLELCFYDSFHNQAAGEEIQRLRARVAELEAASETERADKPSRAKRGEATK